MLEQIVTSKYFQKSEMDESLTDFQEKKNICTGPKIKKPRRKKQVSKQGKGQKDIRTLIRLKKNELLTFTKDFNDVCAQGGIDVDSQQLQLAIALSKSLQQSDQTQTEDFSGNNLTSQERTNRIRKTLQEYGFRIPQVKIKLEGCKRVKKHRKPYKLLQITKEERLQKICNRYSQVLFENPDISFEKETNDCNIDNKLYHLATNITYEFIKTNEVYKTEILHENSFSKGNLLRDWSDIPGRPVSPKLVEDYVISLPDIQCSLNELDIILSGTLNAAKVILKSKLSNSYFNTKKASNVPDIFIACVEKSPSITDKGLNESEFGQEKLSTMLYEQNRSHSPDIFDIDDDPLIDNQNVKKKSTKTGNSLLDLIQPTELTNKVDATQSDNITKRISNDFMDLTECVHITSQSKTKALETIDEVELAHSMEFTKCVNPLEGINISKDHVTKDSLRTEELRNSHGEIDDNSSDNTIINADYIDLTQNCNPRVLVEDSLKDDMEIMDLTQSSNSNELPEVHIPGTQRLSPDDTTIIQYDMTEANTSLSCKKLNNDVIEVNEDVVLDISDDILSEISPKAQNSLNIIHNSYITKDEDFAASKSYSLENISICENKENDKIDLTQSSDSITEDYHEISTSNISENVQINDYDSLGKKGDISIDYDEINSDQVVDQNCQELSDDIQPKLSNPQPNTCENSNSDIAAGGNSDNFDLCDRELNYSIYRSRVNVFEGISIIDDHNEIVNINKSNGTCYNNYTINRSLSESDLPNVNIDRTNRDKHFNITLSKSACSTPIKATVINDKVSIKTPTNSEYVVKLGEVTPMLDYETMSSPERNKELEKYGLKPFKRKRAIQLLTHLYNQTHPVIEQCSEDPVPVKKFKPNSPEKDISEANNVLNKENIYSETKIIPDIRNIECCPDDWVFQKREKAKVYTCPVPLHIAFHNYVSCRRLLREAILRYEPINIDVIHKDLVSYGYKYNPKDLLKFLDRKCITVKTADNNARIKRK